LLTIVTAGHKSNDCQNEAVESNGSYNGGSGGYNSNDSAFGAFGETEPSSADAVTVEGDWASGGDSGNTFDSSVVAVGGW
jgi:hypothetical protein